MKLVTRLLCPHTLSIMTIKLLALSLANSCSRSSCSRSRSGSSASSSSPSWSGSFRSRSPHPSRIRYVENGSLANIIKPNKFGPFPESLVAVYIAQVLEGLMYLHEHGVIHRDIKGANILTIKEIRLGFKSLDYGPRKPPCNSSFAIVVLDGELYVITFWKTVE